jgi:hypothetical protein
VIKINKRFCAAACVLLVALAFSQATLAANAPRDADMRAALTSLREGGNNEARRASTLAFFENLSKRYPDDPYVSVQLANAYGQQARFAAERETKAVWAAKADSLLNEVIAAHPQYLLAQAALGVQWSMTPAALGYEPRAEQQLRRVFQAHPAEPTEDDIEASAVSGIFLIRLYERQAKSLSGTAQSEKRQVEAQVRTELSARFPKVDLTRALEQ